MAVYVHKAYISRNKCEGDHKYFNHEGYLKEQEQEKQQVKLKQIEENEELRRTIEKQQQLINQLELQNSQYRIREDNHQREIKGLLLRIQVIQDELEKSRIIEPELPQPEEKVFLDVETQHSLFINNQQQQTEIQQIDQECQFNQDPEIVKDTKEPQINNKTVRIQAIYYKP